MERMDGKVVVITGASGGLGRAMVQVFGETGAHLFLVGRDTTALEDVSRGVPVRTRTHFADLSESGGANDALAAAWEHYGHVDALINCAGTFVWRRFVDLREQDWATTLDTNLTVPFRLALAFGRRAASKGTRGAIVNIGSIHGALGDANAVPQCAAKAGLQGLTRAVAEALRELGIRVNAILPGSIASNSADRTTQSLASKITQRDIAELAHFLVSDRTQGMTGACIEAYGVTRPVIAAG